MLKIESGAAMDMIESNGGVREKKVSPVVTAATAATAPVAKP
jgi:hypothetical protein